MIVKTKKYQLTASVYIRLGMINILRTQWWVFFIPLAMVMPVLWIPSIWWSITACVITLLYMLFWFIQFYGITYLEQNKMLFERLSYEISSQQIVIQITTKQGMPVLWTQVKNARCGKKYFLLVLSKAHLIYLPHKIFNSQHEIKFVTALLKRKNLA